MTARRATDREKSFALLFVCTANRARSALAEAVVGALASELPLVVGSAGTRDLGSSPVLPAALKAGRELGLDLSRHRSRCLADADAAGADLVLGFERSHVAAAVVDARAPRERVFLLKELVHLLRDAPPREQSGVLGAREAVAVAHARRGGVVGAASEIADPVGAGIQTFREVSRTIQACSHELLELLFARPLPGPRG